MTKTIWHELNNEYEQMASTHLADLFQHEKQSGKTRFQQFSLFSAGLFLDFSKNHITSNTLSALIALAEKINLSQRIVDLFTGKPVNVTERQPALHTALRSPADPPLWVDGVNITAQVHGDLQKMRAIVEKLHTKKWLGFSQKPITDIVHIGIGGSYLGPLLGTEALAPYHKHCLNIHFVTSLDEYQIHETLKKLNPETTLFIIASKSFTTEETMVNGERAKSWLRTHMNKEDLSKHFIAITANPQKALAAGINNDCILTFAPWVGGRYSLWSTMGLPLALSVGMEVFEAMLKGAHTMDTHFLSAPLHSNMPTILALLGFWYIVFFKAETHAILPYDYRLRSLPRYLQQLAMESNGKCVHLNGSPVNYPTAPLIFGETGTEGQHSFHQLLFQGTHRIPCDFIATLNHHLSNPKPIAESESTPQPNFIQKMAKQPGLFAHCLAQSHSLMLGKSLETAEKELLAKGYSETHAKTLAPHLVIPGNQPSNTILLEQLTPHTLGALIALYEHKTFVEGVLWDINSFDQWGVELGKQVANQVRQDLNKSPIPETYDSSTAGLMGKFHQ